MPILFVMDLSGRKRKTRKKNRESDKYSKRCNKKRRQENEIKKEKLYD